MPLRSRVRGASSLPVLLLIGAVLVASSLVPRVNAQRVLLPSGGASERTPISALPFAITECGSYFLTDCLTGVAGSHGITVDADAVTIDLNGFALIGVPGSLSGIHVVGPHEDLTVFGGHLRDWGVHGVDAFLASGGHLEALAVRRSGDTGLRLGDRMRVQGLVATQNGRHGVLVRSYGRVVDSECHFNGTGGDPTAAGIFVFGTDNWIADNNVTNNTKHGIRLKGTGNLVIRNCMSGNLIGGVSDVYQSNAVGQVLGVMGQNGFVNDDPTANLDY